MLQDFDASRVQPQQPSGMGSHPCGMHDFQITNTFLKPSENQQHLMLHVEFTSPVGRHMERFIVDGPSAQAIEIANKQISCICHAVGVHRLTYPKHSDGNPIFDQAARELRGTRGRMDIGYQKGNEPTPEKPAGGYVEIKKYFDAAGNEPGKGGSQAQPQPAQQQPAAPMTQQNGGGWGAPNPTPTPAANNSGGGWNPNPNAPPATGAKPPWGA